MIVVNIVEGIEKTPMSTDRQMGRRMYGQTDGQMKAIYFSNSYVVQGV